MFRLSSADGNRSADSGLCFNSGDGRGRLKVVSMRTAKWILLLVLGASGQFAFGQWAQITGQLMDPSGAGIPDATAKATNVSTGVVKSSITNKLGYYTILYLTPSTYDVSVQAQGFKSATRSGVVLEVGQIARIDFSMEVGQIQQSIEVVSAAAPLLQTESTSVAQLIRQESLQELPLNGRNFTSLASLVPGVTSGGTSDYADSSAIRANGMRVSSTAFDIDGASVINQTFSGTSMSPPPDAMMEFRVQTNNMSAEYGQAGAVISAQIRSGTNQLHGGAYEFLRNDALDARNFFALRKSPLRQNQFGGWLGGPIIKDHSFLFGSYQGTRIRQALTRNAVVPSEAMRSGNFSGVAAIRDPLTGQPFENGRIRDNRISPQASYFLQYYPLPNNPSGTYIFNAASSSGTEQGDLRFDHHFSDTDQVYVSYGILDRNYYTPGGLPANGGVNADVRVQRAGVGHVHTFGPSMINELRVGLLRSRAAQTQQDLGVDHIGQSGIGGLAETSAEFPGFPGLGIAGYQGVNGNLFVPIRFREQTMELRDTFSWIRSKHSVKAGFYFRRVVIDAFNSGFSRGNFTFNGQYAGNAFADFLLGLPFRGQRTFPRNLLGGSQNSQSFFVQDDWKVTPRLTFNFGLRYDLNNPAQYLHNQAATIDFANRRIIAASDSEGHINMESQQVTRIAYPLFADIIIPSSQSGINSSLRNRDLNNWAPRLGAALRLTNDLVFRGGYGIFYPLEEGNQLFSTTIANTPFIVDELATFNTTPVPAKDLTNLFRPYTPGAITIGPLFFFDMDVNRRDLYIQQWNAALQKTLGGVITVEAAYVGNKGTNLSFSAPINIPAPGPGTIQDRREWTRFSEGVRFMNRGNSIYHALQDKAEIRNLHGFSMLASYTLGKSISDQSGDFQGSTVQNPANWAAERGRDDWDRRHMFVLSSTYEIPFLRQQRGLLGQVAGGWNLSNIITLYSGLPFTPTNSLNTANTGRPQRPDRIGDGYLENRSIARWFDASAFRTPAPYTYGNSGRNILDGPGGRTWDIGLLKNFNLSALREEMRLQFRAEAFNLTNTPPFGNPVANIQAGNVGQILSAGQPRRIQLALKVRF